jgi:hypothetical protein
LAVNSVGSFYLAFWFPTAASAVGSRIILFRTVGRKLGRQFLSCYFDSLLPRQHKTTVQKSKDSFPAVISKDDFSELTVEIVKASKNTATFIILQWLDGSRIRQN